MNLLLSRLLAVLRFPDRQRRFVVLLVAAVVLSNLIAIGLGVFSLAASRAQTEAIVGQNASNLAGVLDQSLASSGRTIDMALLALVDELEREAADGPTYLDSAAVTAMLRRYEGWLQEIEGIRVYGAEGGLRWQGHAGAVQAADISDRDYFKALKANAASGLMVSRPVIGRVSRVWVVPFVRRFNRPDGSFGGVVVASMPLEALAERLSRPGLGPGGSAILRYADFGLIARHPSIGGPAGEVGNVWLPEQYRARLTSGGKTVFLKAETGSDGVERALAVQRVEGLPFIVIVGLATRDYLAQWYRDAWQTGFLLAAYLLVSAGSALSIGNFYRRQQDDASRVKESNVRLAALLGELRVRDRALAAAESIGKLGVYSIDLGSKVSTLSPTLRDVFRVPREHPFVPEDWIELVHPEDRRVVERFMVGLVQNGEPFDQSYRIICRDGAIRWVHGVGMMERDAAGQPVSVHGAVQDITEYKQVEASLQHALADYEKLVARIPTGVFGFRWQPDGHFRFTYVSPRFCAQLGVAEEAAMTDAGKVLSCVHPDDRRALDEARRDSLSSGCDFTWEGRVQVGGETRWVEVIARQTRVDDAVLWEGVQVDVTDRKLAELARIESEERYRLLLQYSPVGILQFDADLKVVYCNLQFANIMETPHDYMLSLDCKKLKDQRILPAMKASLAGELGKYEGGYRTSYAGKELLVSVSCAPLRDADGSILGGIVILQDITERIHKDEELARHRDSLEERVAARTADLEAARTEAERLARVKSEFLANMSHEIRTPLNGVLGLARMGYRESVGRDAAQNTFGRILSSGQLLLGIINDILDFSKIEAGKLRIEAIEVDLVKVIGDTLALMEARAADKGLTLHLERAPSLPAACISDPLRIGQILVNLLSNAVKFTERGSVTLFAGAEGNQLVLRVSDTGIGMRQTDIDRMFAPFEQADNSTTRRFGGTGLGLTITHRIVGLMGGSVRAESVEGSGSTFEVRLPYVPLAAAPAEAEAEGADGEPGARLAGIRVLVAEDNEVNQMVLEDHLCSEGADVTLVENGQAAIDCVLAQGAAAFDVVLMDVQMPVMDGHTATRLLGGIAPDLPVIGQTAHALDEERAACLAAGMVDHLAKPIEPEEMVRSILRHRRPVAA